MWLIFCAFNSGIELNYSENKRGKSRADVFKQIMQTKYIIYERERAIDTMTSGGNHTTGKPLDMQARSHNYKMAPYKKYRS